jgi:hypothetical protein
MSSTPATLSLEEWLTLPAEHIAVQVRRKRLGLLLAVDGTRRHYLLHNDKETITDFAEYAEYSVHSYVRVYDLLFGLGVETVMTPFLYPPNFKRGGNYLAQSLNATKSLLINTPFTDLYKRWNLKVRLYGDYDIAPDAASTKDEIVQIARQVAAVSFDGPQRLLLGYCAGTFSQEMILRTVASVQATGEIPTEDQLRVICFPDGPTCINIRIGAGWLRGGSILPPLLDGGKTDHYSLIHLALDVQEQTLRQILYDHLFRRWVGPEDDAPYTPDDLQALREYYSEHQNCVVGLGSLVGPGLWYADHKHSEEYY